MLESYRFFFGGTQILQTVTGIYENGQVRLNEHPARKHTRVIVTFLDDENGLKTLSGIPDCFNHPLEVPKVGPFTRDEFDDLRGKLSTAKPAKGNKKICPLLRY